MRRLAVIALAVVVTATACGGDDGGQAVPACPVERTFVADTTGLVLGARVEPVAIGTDVQCTFTASDGITSVAVTSWRDADAFLDRLDGIERIDLPFADDARWAPSTSTLYAASDDLGVTVQLVDVTGAIADPQRVAVDLAAAALD